MPKLSLTETEPALRRFLRDRLEREGFDVHLVAPHDALVTEGTEGPDLFVLSLTVVSDLEPLLRLRQRTDTPAIALLAEDLEPTVEATLDAGADDCLRKPFSPGELAARVRAVLRRTGLRRPVTELAFPGLTVDGPGRMVVVEGRPVDVPPREFDLLVFLASSPGQVFTRQQVLERVWGSSASWQGSDTVTEHVYRLRRRLGGRHGAWIQTVRSVGYRFTPS